VRKLFERKLFSKEIKGDIPQDQFDQNIQEFNQSSDGSITLKTLKRNQRGSVYGLYNIGLFQTKFLKKHERRALLKKHNSMYFTINDIKNSRFRKLFKDHKTEALGVYINKTKDDGVIEIEIGVETGKDFIPINQIIQPDHLQTVLLQTIASRLN
jgi:hypothetical protein